DLARRVRTVARVDVFRHRAIPASTGRARPTPAPRRPPPRRPHVIAIGASTGGVQTMEAIVHALPGGYQVPVLYIQHISDGFQPSLISWLDGRGAIKVRQINAGALPLPGHVYLPPEQHHLAIDGMGHARTPQTPPRNGHRPSIDVTFESVAAYYGPTAMGVLLTGMGRDGATGLRAIRDAGGHTVVQDPEEAIVSGMPQAAVEMEAADEVLPLERIIALLLSLDPGS
ncbi:MAG: CheB methylesterase domain-containing protein, partial [Guyparkeria sp.]